MLMTATSLTPQRLRTKPPRRGEGAATQRVATRDEDEPVMLVAGAGAATAVAVRTARLGACTAGRGALECLATL